MVFVKTTRRKRGDKTYEYLSLVEAVREGDRTGHRTLLRLGEVTALRESGQLTRIISTLQHHLDRDDERVCVDALGAASSRSVAATATVRTLWCRLGLDAHFAKIGAERGAEVLEHAVFAMVANRLVDPCSKRRLPEWVNDDVVMPAGFEAPSTDQYYRALDAAAAVKEATETELYAALCDLTNLDLRLVCYDVTSTYFEGSPRPRRSATPVIVARIAPKWSSACCAPATAPPSPITCSPATQPTSPPCPRCWGTCGNASGWAGSASSRIAG